MKNNNHATVRFPAEYRQQLKAEAARRGISMEGALLEAYIAWRAAGDGIPRAKSKQADVDAVKDLLNATVEACLKLVVAL